MKKIVFDYLRKRLNRQGRNIIFLALGFIFLYGLTNHAYAFKAIQLDQDRVRITAPGGTTYTGRIEVKNPSEEAKDVKVYLQDWTYSDSQGSKKILPPGTLPASCANWIKIVPQEFTVPPYGRRTLNYSIDIPQNTSGGYQALLFCESLLGPPPAIQQQQTAAAVIPVAVRVGFLFFVEIKNQAERKIEISDLSVKRADKNYEMSFTITNTGNTDVRAGGNFSLMDNNASVFARGQFEDVYTLPKDKAKLSGKWKDILPKGSYDLILTIDLGRALQDYGSGRGPIVVKEAQIEIGQNGEVIRIGEPK